MLLKIRKESNTRKTSPASPVWARLIQQLSVKITGQRRVEKREQQSQNLHAERELPTPFKGNSSLAWSTWPWQPAMALGNFVSNTSDAACSWLKKRECHEAWVYLNGIVRQKKRHGKLQFICNTCTLTLPTVEHIPPDGSKLVMNFLEYQEKQEKLEFWFL